MPSWDEDCKGIKEAWEKAQKEADDEFDEYMGEHVEFVLQAGLAVGECVFGINYLCTQAVNRAKEEYAEARQAWMEYKQNQQHADQFKDQYDECMCDHLPWLE